VTLKTEGNAGTVYKDFCNQLVEKYGPTTGGKIATRTTTGAGKIKTPQASPPASSKVWKFGPTMKDKSSVLISAELAGAMGKRGVDDPQGTVTIRYVNETLTGAAAEADGKTAPKTTTPIKKEDL
jgi:hypothetical protein